MARLRCFQYPSIIWVPALQESQKLSPPPRFQHTSDPASDPPPFSSYAPLWCGAYPRTQRRKPLHYPCAGSPVSPPRWAYQLLPILHASRVQDPELCGSWFDPST
eukprot:3831997-Amphidinium_carterae.1